jgi:hypothetical protein
MSVTEQSTEQVATGVTLTWDSSFHCREARDSGPYALTMTVSYSGTPGTAVVLNALDLTHTTPKPLGQAPEGTSETDQLPLELTAGESVSLTVKGSYELAQTGASHKANLHFCGQGQLQGSELTFAFGMNAHLRGAGFGPTTSNSDAPPVISNIRISPGVNMLVVEWQTDQPTTGQVMIGRDPELMRPLTISSGCDALETHRVEIRELPEVEISGLTAGTLYVQVRARNSDGVTSASEPQTVTLQPPGDTRNFLPLIQRSTS